MPSSRYGDAITVMAEMSWSWDAYQDAPVDLVDEIMARIAGRNRAEREERRKQDAANRRKR